jgi:hypothetical protein
MLLWSVRQRNNVLKFGADPRKNDGFTTKKATFGALFDVALDQNYFINRVALVGNGITFLETQKNRLPSHRWVIFFLDALPRGRCDQQDDM